MSLIASIKRDIKAAFEHDPAAISTIGVPGRVVAVRNPDTDTVEKLPDPVGEKLESLERRVAEMEQRLVKMEGSKDEGI